MKYTLYAWCADDEGGYGICNYGEFSPNLNYYPNSGHRAEPSVKIGDFNTVDELAILILEDMSNCTDDFYMSDAVKEARWLMANLLPCDSEY